MLTLYFIAEILSVGHFLVTCTWRRSGHGPAWLLAKSGNQASSLDGSARVKNRVWEAVEPLCNEFLPNTNGESSPVFGDLQEIISKDPFPTSPGPVIIPYQLTVFLLKNTCNFQIRSLFQMGLLRGQFLFSTNPVTLNGFLFQEFLLEYH